MNSSYMHGHAEVSPISKVLKRHNLSIALAQKSKTSMKNVVFYLRNRNSRQVKTNVPISTNVNFFSKICTSYHVIVETIKVNSSFSPISMSIKSFKRFHHILQIQFRFEFRFEFQFDFRFEFRFDSDFPRFNPLQPWMSLIGECGNH